MKTWSKWSMVVKNRQIMIKQLPDGKYQATDVNLDTTGDNIRFWDVRDENFDTIEDCCIFLGYPIGILPLPILK